MRWHHFDTVLKRHHEQATNAEKMERSKPAPGELFYIIKYQAIES